MRPLVRWCVLCLAVLSLAGCSGQGWRKAPGSMTAKVPEASETEVKPAPVVALPSALPPPVAAPATPEKAKSGRPAEQTKQALEAKPARTAAMAPAKSAEAAAPVPTPPRQAAAADPPAETTSKGCSIAVVGDSLAVGVGMTMEKRLKHSAGVGCTSLGRVSTGLISKRSFDWEKRLAELVATAKPAAVVVVMGGNDANNAIAGKAAGTPDWEAAYREKAEHFLRIASAVGVTVLWVGLPAMRDPAYAARVRAVNAAARQACAAIPGCTYMEAGAPFVDGEGHYAQAGDIDGRMVPLRAKDGVHMTMTGYDLLSRQVLERLAALGALPQ